MGVLVFLFLLGGAGLWVAFNLGPDPRLQAWRKAAESCALVVEEGSSWVSLIARTGPVEVRFAPGGDKGRLTQISVEISGPPDFRALRIGPGSLFAWGREIEVGDPSFDMNFYIEGPVLLVLSLLDGETRRLLFHVRAEGPLEILSGTLQAEMPDEKVPDLLPLLIDAGLRLARPMDIPSRLAENAKGDPVPGVRLHNLLLLTREFPGDGRTREALRAACSDPSPEIRLRAAQELGTEGRSTLCELAESLVDDPVSAEAVWLLEGELPFEHMESLLDRALDRRQVWTARACLEVIGRSGDDAAVGVLEKAMDQERGELAAVAARALEATGSPAAEPSLILALQRDPPDLRVAAASALGLVGSVAAVLPLKEAAERFWLDFELRRATRQAIAQIQSRLPGASPGQLSLAGSEAGQLSLAPDPAGQVSLPGPEDGRS